MTATPLSSPRNERVVAAVRLRDRRERERTGRTLIDGVREVARALDAGVPIVEAFVCPELCARDECREAWQRLAGLDVPVVEVTPRVLDRVAFGDRAEGVVAVAQPVRSTLVRLPLPDRPLVAVVEGVEKPGNLGAVLRSADGAGVAALIAADAATDLYNPNVIRASLGTVFTVPVREATAAESVAWLRKRGMTMYAARVDAALDYADADYTGPCAIVLGSEAHGLTTAWDAADVVGIRLPMLGVADSLNVSTTAAILFYEALRQRRTIR